MRAPRSPSRFLREALAHDVRTRFVGHDADGDIYSLSPARDSLDSLTRSEYLREHVGPLAQTEIERDLLLDDGGYGEEAFGGPYTDRTCYSAADRRGMVDHPFRGTGADDMTTTRYGLGPEGQDAMTGESRFDTVEFGGVDVDSEPPTAGLDGGAGDEFIASGSFDAHFRDFREDSDSDIGADWPGIGPAVPATAPRAVPRNVTGYSDTIAQLAAEEWDASNPPDDSYDSGGGGSLFLPSTTTVLQPLPQFDGDSPADGSPADGSPADGSPTDGSGADMPDDPPISYAEGIGVVGASAAVVGGTMWWLGVKGWWWLAALPLTYATAGLVGVAYVLGKANHGDAAAKAWENSVQSQMLQARLIQRKVLLRAW